MPKRSHGMTKTKPHMVWVDMRARCRCPTHHAYKNYGGRGIKVCERWETFCLFWEDVGPTYTEGLTLDRRDNDGNYGPDNYRWTTRKEQNNNRRSMHWVDTVLGKMSVRQIAEYLRINEASVRYRIKAGWPKERLLQPRTYETPVN